MLRCALAVNVRLGADVLRVDVSRLAVADDRPADTLETRHQLRCLTGDRNDAEEDGPSEEGGDVLHRLTSVSSGTLWIFAASYGFASASAPSIVLETPISRMMLPCWSE